MKVELDQARWDYDLAGDRKLPNVPSVRREGAWTVVRSTCKSLEEVRAGKAKGWFFRDGTRNHRVENDQALMEWFDDSLVFADIESIEDFVREHGPTVVEESDVVGVDFKLTIYNGYLE